MMLIMLLLLLRESLPYILVDCMTLVRYIATMKDMFSTQA